MASCRHLTDFTRLSRRIWWKEYSHSMKRNKKYTHFHSAPKSVQQLETWWPTNAFRRISTSMRSRLAWKSSWYILIRQVFVPILIRNTNGQNATTLIVNKTSGDHRISIFITWKSVHMWPMMATGTSATNFSTVSIRIPWLSSCLVHSTISYVNVQIASRTKSSNAKSVSTSAVITTRRMKKI